MKRLRLIGLGAGVAAVGVLVALSLAASDAPAALVAEDCVPVSHPDFRYYSCPWPDETTSSTTTSTTSTTSSTTTTTAPTTTLPDIPPTVDLGTLQKGEGYEFVIEELDPVTENLVPDSKWWRASYFFDLPYAGDFGWGGGDRCRYRGVYGHLLKDVERVTLGEQFDADGLAIGRFYAVRNVFEKSSQAYIRVNDSFMVEGTRHFDGTLDRNSSVSPEPGFNECTPTDVAYEPFTGPGETPVVVFRYQGEVVEIRDYRLTEPIDRDVRFVLVDDDGSDDRVAVQAYGEDDLPGVIVYYDALVPEASVEAFLP